MARRENKKHAARRVEPAVANFAAALEKLDPRITSDAEKVQELLGRWEQMHEDRPGLLGGELVGLLNETILDEHFGRLLEAAGRGNRSPEELAEYAEFVSDIIREYSALIGILASVELDPDDRLAEDWQKLATDLLEKAEEIERAAGEMQSGTAEAGPAGEEGPGEEEIEFGAARPVLVNLWQKGGRGAPLDQQESRMFQAMREHPEYSVFWESAGPLPGKQSMIEGVNPGAHITMHTMVENQLADNDPPEVRQALDRLMASGVSRHDAIHRIGNLAAEQLYRIMRERTGFDRAAYIRALNQLK